MNKQEQATWDELIVPPMSEQVQVGNIVQVIANDIFNGLIGTVKNIEPEQEDDREYGTRLDGYFADDIYWFSREELKVIA
jgi:hypothetical protein